MKTVTLLILIAVIFPITLPLQPVISYASDKGTIILALDICDKSGQTLSSNADIFSIHECSCKFVPLEFSGFHKISNPAFSSSLISFQKERPPKA